MAVWLRVRVVVLLRVRLLVPPAARLETVDVPVRGAREAVLLGSREGVDVKLPSTVRREEAEREAEAVKAGVDVRLTDGDADDEDEEEPEEVSELELVDVPAWMEATAVVGVDAAVLGGVEAADLDIEAAVAENVEAALLVRETVLELVVTVTEALRKVDGLVEEDREELLLPVPLALELPVPVALALAVPGTLELPVPVMLALAVPDCVDERVPATDELPVAVALDKGVPVAELGEVPDMEEAPVCMEEVVLLTELEGLPIVLVELEGLTLVEEAGVGADEALRRVAMLRPWKVMAERVASASPASHSVVSRIALSLQCIGTSIVMLLSRKQLAAGEKRSSVCAKEYPSQEGESQQAPRQAPSEGRWRAVPSGLPTRSV